MWELCLLLARNIQDYILVVLWGLVFLKWAQCPAIYRCAEGPLQKLPGEWSESACGHLAWSAPKSAPRSVQEQSSKLFAGTASEVAAPSLWQFSAQSPSALLARWPAKLRLRVICAIRSNPWKPVVWLCPPPCPLFCMFRFIAWGWRVAVVNTVADRVNHLSATSHLQERTTSGFLARTSSDGTTWECCRFETEALIAWWWPLSQTLLELHLCRTKLAWATCKMLRLMFELWINDFVEPLVAPHGGNLRYITVIPHIARYLSGRLALP